MAGAGTKILASDYNAIQNIAQTLLGTGSGQYGYGQSVSSSQVRPGDPFKLTDWVNLRNDLLKVGAHQTGSATEGTNLIIPGDLDPRNISSFITKSGTSPCLVTFGYNPATASPPSIGAPYKVQNCANLSYNGVFTSTASSNSTITLRYPTDPGTFDSSRTVKISSVLTDAIRAQYLAYATAKYIAAYDPTITITGTTNASVTVSSANAQVIMVGATIIGSGIPANTTVASVVPGISLTLTQSSGTSVSGATFTLTLVTGIKTVAANQLTPTEAITNTNRTVAWNGNIQSIATYTFPSADSARAFFNSGSQFEVTPSLTGSFGASSVLKDQTWQVMFQQIGTIAFRANDCIQTPADYNPNASQHYPIGWFGLTNSDRLVFSKQAPSGSYSANVLNVFARKDPASAVLILTIRFQDDATSTPPWGIDENVDGILGINFTATRASGSNVSVIIPPVSVTSIA
jgi:hypothetical protein